MAFPCVTTWLFLLQGALGQGSDSQLMAVQYTETTSLR